MPFSYSADYRSMVLEQAQAGAKAVELAKHLEVSEATIHRWIAQTKSTEANVAEIPQQRPRKFEKRDGASLNSRPNSLQRREQVNYLQRTGWFAQKSSSRSWLN